MTAPSSPYPILAGPDNGSDSLVSHFHDLARIDSRVTLDGKSLTLRGVRSVARHGAGVLLTSDPHVWDQIRECFERMRHQVEVGIPVYGCNTGYGGQASLVQNHGSAEERLRAARLLSEAMDFTDVTVGPSFSPDVVRAAMLIRINTLLGGVSAANPSDLKIYTQLLNSGLVPVVGQYGGIGASGDLAHNARVLSVARQRPGAPVTDAHGVRRDAAEALQALAIPPLSSEPKAGLCFINGDNFSTALASLLALDTLEATLLSDAVSSMAIESLRGTNRSFHPMLAELRPHPGQRESAANLRFLLEGSRLACQELDRVAFRPPNVNLQDGYSLRCLPQLQGVNYDSLRWILNVLRINLNSVSDNPLWVPPNHATPGEEPWQWVSGGNFIAMYMVECMDRLRKIMTQITKVCDRQLARLVDSTKSGGLPANLSSSASVSRCAFKGMQIQSGMFDVYAAMLCMPASTMFGVHEEGNQDVTAHSLTSGILALENLRICRYALAQMMIATCQAIDLRGGPSLMAPATRPLYELVRQSVDFVSTERPLGPDIERIYERITDGSAGVCLRERVFRIDA